MKMGARSRQSRRRMGPPDGTLRRSLWRHLRACPRAEASSWSRGMGRASGCGSRRNSWRPAKGQAGQQRVRCPALRSRTWVLLAKAGSLRAAAAATAALPANGRRRAALLAVCPRHAEPRRPRPVATGVGTEIAAQQRFIGEVARAGGMVNSSDWSPSGRASRSARHRRCRG